MSNQNRINQELLGIKNLTTNHIFYNNQPTNKYAVCNDEGKLYSVVGRLYHPIAYGELLSKIQEWIVKSRLVATAHNSEMTKGIITLQLPMVYNVSGQEIK